MLLMLFGWITKTYIPKKHRGWNTKDVLPLHQDLNLFPPIIFCLTVIIYMVNSYRLMILLLNCFYSNSQTITELLLSVKPFPPLGRCRWGQPVCLCPWASPSWTLVLIYHLEWILAPQSVISSEGEFTSFAKCNFLT